MLCFKKDRQLSVWRRASRVSKDQVRRRTCANIRLLNWFTATAMIEKDLLVVVYHYIIHQQGHKHCNKDILLGGSETSLKRKASLQPRQHFILF